MLGHVSPFECQVEMTAALQFSLSCSMGQDRVQPRAFLTLLLTAVPTGLQGEEREQGGEKSSIIFLQPQRFVI